MKEILIFVTIVILFAICGRIELVEKQVKLTNDNLKAISYQLSGNSK